SLANNLIKVKGAKGELSHQVHQLVAVGQQGDSLEITVNKEDKAAWTQAGTTRAVLNNMVIGVSQGVEKKLQLNGVGYRAEASGIFFRVALVFSTSVVCEMSSCLLITTASQTEIIVSVADKQKVGKAAANIRAFRPPEPYKGKGVHYANEHVRRKEAKK